MIQASNNVTKSCTMFKLAPPGDQSGEDLPPCELPLLDDRNRGPVMPVPKGIRPTLSKHRIEVLIRHYLR
jgi:otoferlin